MPGCEVAPLGIVIQSTIDENGDTQSKLRLTHDQSLNPKGTSGRSVNDRVDNTTLTPAKFGKALSRLLYHILFLQLKAILFLQLIAPNEPIYLTKVTFKSEYRQIHPQPNTAVKSCTCIDELLLIALRLTFGVLANPLLWSNL
jgi:hypothetical protein